MLAWRQLYAVTGNGSVATHPDWIETWLQCYGDIVPHRFVIARANGQPQGIALVTEGVGKKNGPFGVRTVHLGTAGEPQPGSVCVEYNRILVTSQYREAFLRDLTTAIHNDCCWEQFRLDGFSETELNEWLPWFPDAEIRSRESKYFDLAEAREGGLEILSRLGKSTRSNIRRRLRKYGELHTEWATNLEEANDIFTEMVELHQARWNAIDEPGAFANPRFLAFQQRLIVRLFPNDRVILFRVRHEGETVGCLMLLVDQNRMLDYLSGLADFSQKPSPGLITHYLCMEQGLDRGFDAYDFLVGDKQHKDNLSSHSQQLCWLTWNRPSLKTTAVDTLRNVKHFLKGH